MVVEPNMRFELMTLISRAEIKSQMLNNRVTQTPLNDIFFQMTINNFETDLYIWN